MASVPSTTSCTSHQQRHQSQQPSCTTFPTARSSSSTASSWCHHHRQCGSVTTGGPVTSSWSHQTANFKWHQLHHGASSTVSSRVLQQPSWASCAAHLRHLPTSSTSTSSVPPSTSTSPASSAWSNTLPSGNGPNTFFKRISNKSITSSSCHLVIFSQSGQQRHRHPSLVHQVQLQQVEINRRTQQHQHQQQVHRRPLGGEASHQWSSTTHHQAHRSSSKVQEVQRRNGCQHRQRRQRQLCSCNNNKMLGPENANLINNTTVRSSSNSILFNIFCCAAHRHNTTWPHQHHGHRNPTTSRVEHLSGGVKHTSAQGTSGGSSAIKTSVAHQVPAVI